MSEQQIGRNDQSNESLFGASRDKNIDLSKFLTDSKNTPTNKESDDATIHRPQQTMSMSMGASRPVNANNDTKIEMTPLQAEMAKRKDPNQGSGLVVTEDEMKRGEEKTEIRVAFDSDERVQSFNDAIDDGDILLKQRRACVMLKPTENGTQYAQMVDEISRVKFDDEGNAYYDYEYDDDGNRIIPQWIRLRTEDDPPFESGVSDNEIVNGPVDDDDDDDDEDAYDDGEDEDDEDDEKRKIVQVIIDKTGLGSEFEFTEDERKKMSEAAEIRLTEVEVLDLASITTVRPEREGYTGHIHDHELRGSRTTISFPASGFKADLSGLTYGEIGDISLSMDSITADKYRKRLTTIYNKLRNLSCGPFESFDDFLKNIAYTDIPLAIYGLFVSSFPEVQTIALRCGRSSCQKSFEWNYETRNVLRLEKSDEIFLNKMSELATADPSEYDEIYKRAAVRNSKYIRLPNSGYIVEMGIASAYEFLNNFIPVLDEKAFKEAFGDDPNHIYTNNILLLTSVLSVLVPHPDGDVDDNGKPIYIKCETYKEILDAIYSISPSEIKILANIVSKFQRQYQAYFSFVDVRCPHCGNVTPDLEVTMDDLVFQTYQRLLSTEIDVTAIQTL